MYAIAFANAGHRPNALWKAREERYLKLAKKYDGQKIAKACALVVQLMEEDTASDPIGSTFELLDMGGKYAGQFFTPMDVSRVLAGLTFPNVQEAIAANGFVKVHEPSVGCGRTIIALDWHLRNKGISPGLMRVQAIDIDLLCIHMSLITFSLLGIPATLIHGNTLTLETWSVWQTPMVRLSANRMPETVEQAVKEYQSNEEGQFLLI